MVVSSLSGPRVSERRLAQRGERRPRALCGERDRKRRKKRAALAAQGLSVEAMLECATKALCRGRASARLKKRSKKERL